MIMRFIPRRLKQSIVRYIRGICRPTALQIKYLPYRPDDQAYLLPKRPSPQPALAGAPILPIPPAHLWLGYGNTEQRWIESGRIDVQKMLDLVRDSGLDPASTARILDFGCGAGRLTRHLQFLAEGREIFGVDVSAEHIKWCQANLAPPFRFATTTTIPHLPFEDKSFGLICCGSVFTHIDDLAEAWLLELGRILAPDGRLYVTIHDNHTIQLLEGRERNHWLAELLRSSELYRKAHGNLGMLVIYRDTLSQVFYDLDFFLQMAQQTLEVVSITEEAYQYQTGIVLRRR